MEGNLEIDDDGEAFGTQTRRLRVQITDTGFGADASQQAQSQAVSSQKNVSRLYGVEGRLMLARCLQYILQREGPRIPGLMFPQMNALDLADFQRNYDIVLKNVWLKSLRHWPKTVNDLYAIVFVALRQLNQRPVYLDDFLPILQQNKVAYYGCFWSLPASYRQKAPMQTAPALSAHVNVSEGKFVAAVYKWQLLHSDTIPDSFGYYFPGVFRLCCQLRLAHAPVVAMMYLRMCQRLKRPWNGKKSVYHCPDVVSMACAVWVIRVYFRASQTVPRGFLEEFPMPNDVFSRPFQQLTPGELASMSDEDTLNYLRWVYEGLVPETFKNAGAPELPTLLRQLLKIFAETGYAEQARAAAADVAEVQLLELEENNLTTQQLQQIDSHVARYVCAKFGVKSLSLILAMRSVQRRLVGGVAGGP